MCCFKKGKLIVVTYVDDLLIVGPRKLVDSFKAYLKSKFNVENGGPVNYFLGLTVMQTQPAQKRTGTWDRDSTTLQ